MSFEILDCTSPVRVRVKKASDRRWRWRKTEARKSCITRWPTWFESRVWITPKHAGRNCDRDDSGRVEREGRRVVLADRLQDVPEQERWDNAEPRRDDDQEQHPAQPHLVRREEPADPVQVRPAHRRVGGTLRRRFRGVKEHAHRGSEYVAGPAWRLRDLPERAIPAGPGPEPGPGTGPRSGALSGWCVGLVPSAGALLHDPGSGRRDRVPHGSEGIQLLAVRLTLLRVLDEPVERVMVVCHLQSTVRSLRRPE